MGMTANPCRGNAVEDALQKDLGSEGRRRGVEDGGVEREHRILATIRRASARVGSVEVIKHV
jgi:hypothetical protein